MKLLKQQAEVEQRIKKRRIEQAEAAPVYTLNDDVLKLIFQVACGPSWEDDTWVVDKSSFTVSHVCQRWRKAALTFPHIWRYIDLSLFTPLVRLSVERSGNLPIHVVYRESKETAESYLKRPDDQVTKLRRVFGTNVFRVLQQAARWSSCSVRTHLPFLVEIFSGQFSQQELPMLEHLQLFLYELPQLHWQYDRQLHCMPRCLRLITLALQGINTSLNSPSLRLVRKVYLSRCAVCELHLHELATTALQLEKLTLHHTYLGPDQHAPEGDIAVFTRLKTLDLFAMLDRGLDRLLFAAPELITINFRELLVCTREDGPASIIFATYPSVQQLQITRGGLIGEGDHGDRLLSRFPNVVDFRLVHFSGIPALLRSLTVEVGGDVAMPLIESLTIDLHLTPLEEREPSILIRQALLNFIKDRARRQKPLRELRLSGTMLEEVGPDFMALLSALVTVQEIPHDPRCDRTAGWAERQREAREAAMAAEEAEEAEGREVRMAPQGPFQDHGSGALLIP